MEGKFIATKFFICIEIEISKKYINHVAKSLEVAA
jgi:hypothetical protein